MIYPYHLHDGHLIADLDGRAVLLDTGSPTSFGRGAAIRLDGRDYPWAGGFMGLDAKMLAGLVGTELEGLLGMDVLQNLDLRIDPASGTSELSHELLPLDGQIVPTDSCMGIPLVAASVGVQAVRCFLDTGARLSYFTREIAGEYESAGETEDFYPGFGRFFTPTWRVPVTLAGVTLPLLAGVLPAALQGLLAMGGAGGILGTALLDHFRLTLSPRRGLLALAPHTP
mgnify:CR=1 FL=1